MNDSRNGETRNTRALLSKSALILVACLALVSVVAAQKTGLGSGSSESSSNRGESDKSQGYVFIDPDAPRSAKAGRLLDRGDGVQRGSGNLNRTHVSPMATLDVPPATLALTMVSIGFFPTMAPGPSAFIGNFFSPVADFPPSYYPFFVTGAFAWGTGPPTMVTLGAGVATGPFPVGTAMWAAFATAGVPGPPAMTSGFFGGAGIFPHSPPTVGVPTGLGVACGIYSVPAGGAGAGAIIVTPAMDRPRFTFNGPPLGPDLLASATFFLDNNMASGCFISGATVPVELQSFSIE